MLGTVRHVRTVIGSPYLLYNMLTMFCMQVKICSPRFNETCSSLTLELLKPFAVIPSNSLEHYCLFYEGNIWPQGLADYIIRLAAEFQNLIDCFEERFHGFDKEHELRYACPNEDLGVTHRGRSRLLIPKEQLEGLRS